MSENESVSQFIDKLLSKKIFNCARCTNLLKPPIYLIEDVGNVCSTCRTNHLPSSLVIHNTQLEKILTELTLPCQYQSGGCVDRIPFADLPEHEANCSHRAIPCLIEGCEWVGPQSELFTHFDCQHSHHVRTSDTNKFDIKLKLSEPIAITTLLKGRAEHLLLVRKNDAANSLKYSLFSLKSGPFAIKHTGRNGNCVEARCRVGDGVELDIDILKRVTGAEDEIDLQVDAGGEEAVFDEKMLQHFECPVCKSLMRPPIYQCKYGHSFCNVCKPKLEKCPTCRASFEATRNYALEGLTLAVPYGCMYSHLGCEKLMHANDVGEHEASCPCKPYPCPFEECSFMGSRNNIGAHIEETHGDRLIKSNYFKTTVEFRFDQLLDFYNFNNKYYFMFNDNIFRLSFKRNSEYCFWAVEVLKQKENQHFTYEIGIIDMRKKDRKLIRTDSCFIDTNQDDLFKKCILFPNNILRSYCCNFLFSFYCQINN